MRIGIDARAAYDITDGIGRYCVNLLRALAQRPDQNEYIVLKNAEFSEALGFDGRFEEIVVRARRFSIWEQAVLPKLLSRLRLDGFHSLHFTLPVFHNGPQIMTVHDIMPLRFPWFFGEHTWRRRLASMYFGLLVRWSAKRAAWVIANSDYTAQDMTKYASVPAEHVTRIYHGIDHITVAPAARIREIREKYHLLTDYVLTVTNFRPYKNIPSLLRAFSMVKPQRPVHMVVAGKHEYYEQPVHALAREIGDDRVRFLGFVPDNELNALIQGASVFVFPSLYEGFGFPMLEAMALGTPVVASRVASLPEICGEAALYVEPTDVDGLASQMLCLLENRDLAASLAVRGQERAKRFSWREAAQATLRLYEDIFGSDACTPGQ